MNKSKNLYGANPYRKSLGNVFLITGAIVAMTSAGIGNANAQNISVSGSIIIGEPNASVCSSVSVEPVLVDTYTRRSSSDSGSGPEEYAFLIHRGNTYWYYNFECSVNKFTTGTSQNRLIGSFKVEKGRRQLEATTHNAADKDILAEVNLIGAELCYSTQEYHFYREKCLNGSRKVNINISAADILQHLTAEDIAKLLPEQTPQKTIAEIISELNTELDRTDGTKENKDISEFRKTVGKAINGMDFTKFYDPNWVVK